jgi:hypothetical protein
MVAGVKLLPAKILFYYDNQKLRKMGGHAIGPIMKIRQNKTLVSKLVKVRRINLRRRIQLNPDSPNRQWRLREYWAC